MKIEKWKKETPTISIPAPGKLQNKTFQLIKFFDMDSIHINQTTVNYSC